MPVKILLDAYRKMEKRQEVEGAVVDENYYYYRMLRMRFSN